MNFQDISSVNIDRKTEGIGLKKWEKKATLLSIDFFRPRRLSTGKSSYG